MFVLTMEARERGWQNVRAFGAGAVAITARSSHALPPGCTVRSARPGLSSRRHSSASGTAGGAELYGLSSSRSPIWQDGSQCFGILNAQLPVVLHHKLRPGHQFRL